MDKPLLIEIFWPVEVTSSTNTIVIETGSGLETIELDTGFYYTEDLLDVSNTVRLPRAIDNRISFDASESIDFSTVEEERRIKYAEESGTSGTFFDLDNASWTLPPSYLGWRPSDSRIDPDDPAPWLQDGRFVLPNLRDKAWDVNDQIARRDVVITDWRTYTTRKMGVSDDGPNPWPTTTSESVGLSFTVQGMPACLIWEQRAKIQSKIDDFWSTDSSLLGSPVNGEQIDNVHPTLERMWDKASAHSSIHDPPHCLMVVLRYSDAPDIHAEARLSDAHMGDFNAILSDAPPFERYDVTIDLEIRDLREVP